MNAGQIAQRARKMSEAVDRITDEQLARALKHPANREKLIETLLVMGEVCRDAQAGIDVLRVAIDRLERALGIGSIQA